MLRFILIASLLAAELDGGTVDGGMKKEVFVDAGPVQFAPARYISPMECGSTCVCNDSNSPRVCFCSWPKAPDGTVFLFSSGMHVYSPDGGVVEVRP